MRKVILIATIGSMLFFHNFFAAKSLTAQTNTASPLPAPSAGSNPPAQKAQTPSLTPQQSPVLRNPAASPSSAVAAPADIAPLLKEMLSANNQVVGQVASMYQNLGLFNTIIVTLVGVIATLIGILARKSVQGFIRDWSKKMESLEKEMKDSLSRLREAVTAAEGSAKKAAEHEQSIMDGTAVLSKNLQDVDRLQTSLESCLAQVRGEVAAVQPSPPVSEGGVLRHSPEASTTAEDAEVAARLQGKIDPEESKE